MRLAIRQTAALTVRLLLALWRQPWFVGITLVQPMIWLLLFGALFKKVVEIPGFHGGSYIQFLTPGIVIMSALFSAGWNGMALIDAINRGIMDRFLVSPVWRGAIVVASSVYGSVVILVQTAVILAVAFAVGAHFSAVAIVMMLALATLLGGAVTGLSNALALVARQEETLIGAVQFVVLPATFLSSGLMAANLMPHWVQQVARFNPVNWAVTAARDVTTSGTDWGSVGMHAGLLAVLLVACTLLATRAFRVYQRAI
jgi:ABC-2 type transport system permease protein